MHSQALTARSCQGIDPAAVLQVMETPEDLDRLIAAAQAGDDGALQRAIAVIRRGVLRYLLAGRVPLQDADDVAQDVCMGVLGNFASWQDTGRSFWAYVFRATRNKMTDRARAVGRRGEVVVDVLPDVADPQPGPDELLLTAEGTTRMAALLGELPARHREVLVLRAVVGLSAAETGQVLGLTAGSVQVLQHRATRRLRILLAAPAAGQGCGSAGVLGRTLGDR